MNPPAIGKADEKITPCPGDANIGQAAFFFEKLAADAGAVFGRNQELSPVIAGGGPFLVEEAGAIAGRGEKPDGAVGGGEYSRAGDRASV